VGDKYNCGCRSGKSCFLTYSQAQAEVKRFKVRRAAIKIAGWFLGAYRCKFCGHFHVGNAEKSGDRRRSQPRDDD
jgi:hypothetical protein